MAGQWIWNVRSVFTLKEGKRLERFWRIVDGSTDAARHIPQRWRLHRRRRARLRSAPPPAALKRVGQTKTMTMTGRKLCRLAMLLMECLHARPHNRRPALRSWLESLGAGCDAPRDLRAAIKDADTFFFLRWGRSLMHYTIPSISSAKRPIKIRMTSHSAFNLQPLDVTLRSFQKHSIDSTATGNKKQGNGSILRGTTTGSACGSRRKGNGASAHDRVE